MLTNEQMTALAEPFNVNDLEWKPGATTRDKSRGLALAYVDMRRYVDRLNEVFGGDWSDDVQVMDGGTVVIMRLTCAGVTRSDVGESPASDKNSATSSIAQAFKRACVKFGLGAYLYRMPQKWVAYDPQKKRFTPDGLAQLKKVAAGQKPSPDLKVPAGEYAGKTLAELKELDLDYLEAIASSAQDWALRVSAQELLK